MSNRKLSRKEKILIKASEKPLNRSSSVQMTSTGWKLPLLLAIISFILYANTLGHGFVLDDYSLILENRITKMGTSAIPEIFQTGYRSGYFMKDDGLYRPLVKSMFAAEWQWGGGSPLLFHWINVLLYSFTGFFLYGMLLRLTRGNVFVAFVSSLLFICHPIHTEVVANIKSRDEILAFLFCILSLDYIFKWTVSRSTTSLLVSAFFFFLGLLSKESAITFLAVVPLSFWVFSDQSFLKNIKGLLPLILVTLLFLLMRSHALNGHGFTLNPNIADNLLSATTNPVEKLSTAVLILGLYLKLLLVPHPLVFDYSFNQIPIIGPGSFGFLISFISFLVLAAVAVKKLPCKSVLSFCVLYFFVTISVASNIFFLTGSSMGERFVYMPSLGFCMGVAFLIFTLLKVTNLQNDESRIFKGTSLKAMLLVLGIVSLFSLKVVARNPVWKDNFTLYSNDVKLSPNSTRTHYYLGNYLVKPENWKGKSPEEKNRILQEAIFELRKSVNIYYGFPDAHIQMGVGYGYLDMPDSAKVCYERALAMAPNNHTVMNNLGTIYFMKQDISKAQELFQKAVATDPEYADAWYNLGSTYGVLQQYQNALQCLLKADYLNPGNSGIKHALSVTYGFMGDNNAAARLEAESKRLSGVK